MIENGFRNVLDMLEGNINRIVLTEDKEELLKMQKFAKYRIDKLVEYKINYFERIRENDL